MANLCFSEPPPGLPFPGSGLFSQSVGSAGLAVGAVAERHVGPNENRS